jgi:PAS domain S-box-containing protein
LLASLIIAFAVIITRSMAYPLTQFLKGTEIIAGGNFDYKTNIRTPDEIGNLSTAFDTMTEDLKKITVSRDELSQEIKIRRQAEEALRESEEKFSKAFQTSPYAITITRAEDGEFVEVNEAFTLMTGFTREESFASSSVELKIWVNDEDRRCVVAALSKGQAVVGKEFQFMTKIGKVITCLFSAQIIRLSIGNCILSSINDLTERKQAEEEKAKLEDQLRRSQKMESIGSLAGGIAHDLNNILFPISGLSEMLLDDIPPDTPEYKSVEQIHKSAKRGGDLVKQILYFSRQSNPQKLPIRIQPILKEVLKLAQATIPKHIEITNHINTNCGMISADPTQIHQIAMNLITNAFHAVEQHGGMIDIALKEMTIRYYGEKDEITFNSTPEELLPGRYACITVSDTGTGIDQTLIDKIFDPYFTTKELGKGTGLGLSVVHGIVKEHGGDIRVHSEVGKGTAFHVYLPLLEDAGDSKTAAVTRNYPTGGERILLVDDEETIVLLEQMMLERLGYQVTARTSSPDALAAFKANPGNFDLVISDRSMPNMTGEQLAMEMISIKPGIPVIICTGFSDENDVNRAKAMGVKGFLMKPIAISDLAEMVRNVLDEVADNTLANEKKEAF